MTALEVLAEFVHTVAEQPEERLGRVKLHVLDTFGAMLAGGESARSTEIDDIHLSSCTTPGSAIVPAALDLAARGALRTWGEFSTAVLAGYEVLIRLGVAINGPVVLGEGIWPTYFSAPLGSAAAASRAYGLSAAGTAGALSTALSFCTGTSMPAHPEKSSRWFVFEAAVGNGVSAARAARDGQPGSADLLERYGARIAGVRISKTRLLAGLGRRFWFDETGFKAYAIARQALAAVEAARELAAAESIDPSAIMEIRVGVPLPQLRIIDRPEAPQTRIASIASVQFQIALALLAPERLLDVCRRPPFVDDRIGRLMAKVTARHEPRLDQYYPAAWPGQVEIRTGRRRLRHTILYPRGDARNPFHWEDVVEKFQRLAQPKLDQQAVKGLIHEVRQLEPRDPLPPTLLRQFLAHAGKGVVE